MTWILPPQLFCPSAPASECSTSESVLPSAEPVLWATSSGTPSPRPSSWRGWKTRPWSRRLFGRAISSDSRGSGFVGAWTSSLRASRASRIASLDRVLALMTSAGSGPSWPPAFAFYDRASSSWKTSPASDLLGDWMPFSGTWPRSGSVADGRACELPTLAPRTNANGCSSSAWPTPGAGLHNDGESPESFLQRQQKWEGKYHNSIPLGVAAKMWPTTTTMDAESAGRHSTQTGVMHSGTTLTDAIRSWAQPNARDHKGCDLPSRHGGTSLAEQTQRGRFSHRDQAPPSGPGSLPSTRSSPLRLNPVFGCWLMGWPTWWTNTEPTACARSEMASYLSRLRSQCAAFSGIWLPGER